jgi:hypothetical protein
MEEIPVIENEELCKALQESYSLGQMFRSKKTLHAQPIKTPVEHDGKFYISFHGSWALLDGEHEEYMEISKSYAYRLHKPEEWPGEVRIDVEHSPGGYAGMLVTDPQGREWVVGEEEFCAMYSQTKYPKQYSLFSNEENGS